MDSEDIYQGLIKYSLMNCPVGEHKEVLNSLQVLLGSELIQSETVSLLLLDALSSYGTIIKHESHQIQLTPFSRVSGCTFFDPKENLTFDVNPFELSISNLKPHPSSSQFASDLQSRLDTYLQQHFNEFSSGRVFSQESSHQIFFTSQSINLKNMWTSSWTGNWQLTPTNLSGKTSLKIHYFEEGNFQLSESKSYSVSFAEAAEPLEVIRLIKEFDTSFQNSTQELISTLPARFYKPMRRSIPVTHTRFSEMSKSKMLS